MIDFHSHIIPSVDDGSSSFQMSLNMIENSKRQGVKAICATPHFIVGEYEIDRIEYEDSIEKLRKGTRDIKITNGLELYINPELPYLYEKNKIWGINNKSYLLIELPMRDFPIYTKDVFYELRLLGLNPIIAHPERNIAILKDPKLLIDLVDQGTLIQMNAGSLIGIYGDRIKKFAESLVDKNLAHILGSDGHNDSKRNTNIKDAFEIIKSRNLSLYKWILNNEEKVLDGQEVEILEILLNKRKKLFEFFKKN